MLAQAHNLKPISVECSSGRAGVYAQAGWFLTGETRLNDGTANIFVVRYQFNPGYKWPLMHPKRGAYW